MTKRGAAVKYERLDFSVMDDQAPACPVGYFKSVYGSAPCSACPSNSRTGQEGSLTCECRSGFYRSATDANSSSCTRML
ncbi:hypothetical protein CRUP_037818 [Coryphaenoides rupestris]|nr:hypothetical protein CRUP_037818 [Coryphaenoides rupestris]